MAISGINIYSDLINTHFFSEREAIYTGLTHLLAQSKRSVHHDSINLLEALQSDRYSRIWVQDEMQTLNIDSTVIAASLLHKKMMKAILTPWCIAYLLGKQPPITGLALAHQKPYYLLWRDNMAMNESIDPYAFLSQLSQEFSDHMYQHYKLSPVIAYGNAALAIAQPWSRLEAYRHDSKAVVSSVKAFFAQLTPALTQALEWHIIEKDALNAAYPRRRSCCLKYRVHGKVKCSTCNKENRKIQHNNLINKMVAK